MQLSNKVVVVTAAASGLGKKTAQLLAKMGAIVVVADINQQEGQLVARDINGHFVLCNVVDEQEARVAVDFAASFGELVALVNCSGIVLGQKTLGKSGTHDLASFTRVININLVGSFNMIRLCAEKMIRNTPQNSGERGVIISTASIAAFEGQAGQPAYSASKGGIVAMTLPIARDLARYGIRNMAIAPGIFATPMIDAMTPELQDSLAQNIPFSKRLGTPNDFAQLVLHIFDNEMLNGEVIRLDGAARLAG